MKNLTLYTLIGAMYITAPALAKSLEEEKQDVRDQKAAIAETNKDIAQQEHNIKVNRAEKADAKASGNPLDQASQSIQIGANKAALAAKEAERDARLMALDDEIKDVRTTKAKDPAAEKQRMEKLSALEKEQKELRAAQAAVAKDNEAIAKQERNIDVNRAEKEAAKAEGDIVDQASQSTQIGANKAAIAEKKVERSIDQKRVEKNEKDIREVAPAAGKSSNY